MWWLWIPVIILAAILVLFLLLLFLGRFRNGALRYSFTLAPDGKVAGLLLQP